MAILQYDPNEAHYVLYPTDNPKYWALWYMKDRANGHELYVGTVAECTAKLIKHRAKQ